MSDARALLYIPTNRTCTDAVEHAVAECTAIAGTVGSAPLPVVIDQPSGPHSEANAEALRVAAGAAGTDHVYLTEARWAEVSSLVLSQLNEPSVADAARSLLDRRGVAYGVAVNRAYLLAVALGVDRLHRRDSDHLPLRRPDGLAHPGVLEAAAIGRPVREVVPPSPATDTAGVPTGPITFVGSSMCGEAPIDRRDLMDTDHEFVVELEALAHPGRDLDRVRRRVRDYYVVEPSLSHQGDFYRLDDEARGEVGVSCVTGLHRTLPEMPVLDTLGCDYMGKNLLYQVGRPVVFHSRKMQHRHDEARSARTAADAAEYTLRDLRFMVLRRVWGHHNAHLRELIQRDGLGLADVAREVYASSFRASAARSEELTDGVVDGYRDVVHRAALRAEGDAHRRLRAARAAIDDHGGRVVHEVAEGIEEYCRLVDLWPALVAAATQSGEQIREYLQSVGRIGAHW